MKFSDITNYFKEKKVYSLALYQSDEQLLVDGLLVSVKKKGELEILEKMHFGRLEEFLEIANTNYPVVFNFYGKGTNSKKVENKRGYLQKILFRSNPADFYFYEVQYDDYIFISVARREVLEMALTSFREKELYVVDFTIGAFPLQMIHRSFPSIKEMCNRDQQLIFEKGLVSFQERSGKEEENYNIENERFTEKELPAFANLLSYQYGAKNNEAVNLRLETNREEFKFKGWLHKFGAVAIILLLLSLTIGHFTKIYYQQKLVEIKQRSFYMQTKIARIQSLENEIKNKKEILNASGFGAIGFLSKYSSEIVNDVPKEIVLDLLEVQPLKNRVKPNEEVLLQNEFIEIGGISSDELAFNDWLQHLDQKKWVKKLEISSYEKTNKNGDKFELLLQINSK